MPGITTFGKHFYFYFHSSAEKQWAIHGRGE